MCSKADALPLETGWACLELSALLAAQKTMLEIRGVGHRGEMEGRGREGKQKKAQGCGGGDRGMGGGDGEESERGQWASCWGPKLPE